MYYLVEERDSIISEKKKIRSQLNRLLEYEEVGPQAGRPNLLHNPDEKKIRIGSPVREPCKICMTSNGGQVSGAVKEDQ